MLRPDGTYVLPSGKVVKVPESKTSGLQEAIDRAVAEGLDLFVAGGDYQRRVYRCSVPVVFPPMQGKWIELGAATIDFNGFADPLQPGMVFDSCMNVYFECHAQLVYHMNGAVLRFEPQHNLPVDDFVGPTIVASRFRFAAISHVNTPVTFVGNQGGIAKDDARACCVVFAPRHGINRCEFVFTELLGGNFGIRVETPAEGGNFAFNQIAGLFVHEQFHTSVAEGTLDGCPRNRSIRGNRWDVHCAPSPGARAIDTHGNHGRWLIRAVAERGPLAGGLITHPTTTHNTFILQDLDGPISGPFAKSRPGTNRYQ